MQEPLQYAVLDGSLALHRKTEISKLTIDKNNDSYNALVVLSTLLNLQISFMSSTLDRITASTSKFIATTRSVCRTYREFDVYSQEEMLIWLQMAMRLQSKVKCDELQETINELQSAIQARA